MIYLIAYLDDGEIIVREFKTRESMLKTVQLFKRSGIEILCVWTEGAK